MLQANEQEESLKSLPLRMYEQGYRGVLSIVPPGAPISPLSQIPPGAVGKIPGVLGQDGKWIGYRWRDTDASIEDVRRWVTHHRANIGLRSDNHPGLDLDISDETLADMIEELAVSTLGTAPARFGRAPRRLGSGRCGGSRSTPPGSRRCL